MFQGNLNFQTGYSHVLNHFCQPEGGVRNSLSARHRKRGKFAGSSESDHAVSTVVPLSACCERVLVQFANAQFQALVARSRCRDPEQNFFLPVQAGNVLECAPLTSPALREVCAGGSTIPNAAIIPRHLRKVLLAVRMDYSPAGNLPKVCARSAHKNSYWSGINEMLGDATL